MPEMPLTGNFPPGVVTMLGKRLGGLADIAGPYHPPRVLLVAVFCRIGHTIVALESKFRNEQTKSG